MKSFVGKVLGVRLRGTTRMLSAADWRRRRR